MDELAKRVQRAAESILENESLTAGLSDPLAQVSLDWGIACAEHIARSTAGMSETETKEAMSQRLRATRRLMRRMRRWMTHRAEMDAQARAQALAQLIEQAAIIYQNYTPPDDEGRAVFLRHAPGLSADPIKMMTDLRALVAGSSDDTTNDSGGTHGQEIHPQKDHYQQA